MESGHSTNKQDLHHKYGEQKKLLDLDNMTTYHNSEFTGTLNITKH